MQLKKVLTKLSWHYLSRRIENQKIANNMNIIDVINRAVVIDNKKEEAENLVTCVHSGPLGGDVEIGAMIANNKIDVLFFFCDNLIQQGHQNDVSALTRLASLYNIAFATNRTTADMIITSPLLKDNTYQRIIPAAIENYKNRKL